MRIVVLFGSKQLNRDINIVWEGLKIKFNNDFASCYNTVHQAIQFLALIGKSFLSAQKDDSQTAVFWDREKQVFQAKAISSPKGIFLVSLNPRCLTVTINSDSGELLAAVNLKNKTRRFAYANIKNELAKLGFEVNRFYSDMHYDLPFHSVNSGGKYLLSESNYHNEFVKHYNNAQCILESIVGGSSNTNMVLCWPHHFDLSVRLKSSKKEAVHSLLLGYSPADLYYPEPYFYIKLDRARDCEEIRCCSPQGGCHEKDWFGLVLMVSTIFNIASPIAQEASVRNFFANNLNKLNSEG